MDILNYKVNLRRSQAAFSKAIKGFCAFINGINEMGDEMGDSDFFLKKVAVLP